MNIEYFEVEGTVLKKYNGDTWRNSDSSDVIVPSGITEIGESAFEKCKLMRSVEIPEGVETISEYAFYACENLKEVKLPKSIKQIKKQAFACCCSLEKIKLTENITEIGEYAFSDCLNLKNIFLPNKIEAIKNGTFSCCSSLSTIKLPQNLNEIEEYAFNCCESLSNVAIPYGVKKICNNAFAKCGFKSIEIPNTVQEIDDSFKFGKLEKIIIYGQETKISGSFSGNSGTSYLYYGSEGGRRQFQWDSYICIKCPINSYAHQYAMENNIPCEPYSDIMQVEPVVWQAKLLMNKEDDIHNCLELTIGNHVKLAVIDDRLGVLTVDDKLITYMSNERSREISLKLQSNYTYISTIGNVLKDNQDMVIGIILKIEEYPPMPECNQKGSLDEEFYEEIDHMEALNSYMSDFPDDDAYENWSESNDF